MAKKREADTNGTAAVAPPASAVIAAAGVTTGQDFARLMSSLMSDVLTGKVGPSSANAVCNAGGKLLKVVEMQYKYGSPKAEQQQPMLMLAPK